MSRPHFLILIVALLIQIVALQSRDTAHLKPPNRHPRRLSVRGPLAAIAGDLATDNAKTPEN